MTKVTFFHQKRQDLAVRTGVEIDGWLVLGRSIGGLEETDPSLLWYVEVRCETEAAIAPEAPAVREFFTQIAGPIKLALSGAAEDVRAGLDSGLWPMRRTVRDLPKATRAEIVCSAMRRITDGQISETLAALAADWPGVLNSLEEETLSAR